VRPLQTLPDMLAFDFRYLLMPFLKGGSSKNCGVVIIVGGKKL
jgi:hypothetical protein